MANEQNLTPYRTVSEARENGRKGGNASGHARAEKKTAKERMACLLSLPIDKGKPKETFKSVKDIKGENVTALMAGFANLTKDVAKGDKKAIELALKLTGEMTEQIQVQTTDENIEALRAIFEEED